MSTARSLALVDLQAAITFMIVALASLAILGNSLALFAAILGVHGWESYARLVRSSALSAHTLPLVDAARAMGASPLAVDPRHVLPTVAHVVIVQATLNVPANDPARDGAELPRPRHLAPLTSLGQLLGDGLARAPWLAMMPGALIFVTTLSVGLLGDALRDRLDPALGPARAGSVDT